MPKKNPNHQLRKLMEQASLGNSALASEVNRLGSRLGIELRYDRSSVSHWLAGSMPRTPVIPLIVNALSAKLGKSLTPVDAGFTRPDEADQEVGHDLCGDPLTGLERLAEACLDHRSRAQVHRTAYRTADFSWDGLAEQGNVLLVPPVTGKRLKAFTTAQIQAAEETTALLGNMDDLFGGGHACRATTAYLAGDILEMLSRTGQGGNRPRLVHCAARLAQRLGIKHVDRHEHGLAQSYYLVALRISTAARSYGFALQILGDLANQATMLGHPQYALKVVANAKKLAGESITQPPGMALLLQAQEAVAYAELGRAGKALGLLDEISFLRRSRTGERSDPVSAYGAAVLDFRTSQAYVKVHDLPLATESLLRCLRDLPSGQRRARILTTAMLAECQLNGGRNEAAFYYWNRFLDEYQFLHSSRAESALRGMIAHLRRMGRTSAVGQLLSRCEPYELDGCLPSPDLPGRSAGGSIPAP